MNQTGSAEDSPRRHIHPFGTHYLHTSQKRLRSGDRFPNFQKARCGISLSAAAHAAVERTCPEHWVPGFSSHPSHKCSKLYL